MVQTLSKLVPIFFPKVVTHLSRKEKIIYLTFDDGPTETCLPFILSTLQRYNAEASFFCVGNNMLDSPHLVEDMVHGGHKVYNHTQDHKKGWLHNANSYLTSVHEAHKIIPHPKAFRPPYGKITWKQYRRLILDWKIIYWDTLTEDYNTKISPEKCLALSCTAQNGSILVFHDNKKAWENMSYALPRFLEIYSKKGYKFESLPY
ncbi:MAG: peptidoglycan/xylan/chitin deacetylase (PgdA/CDA1 family) [Luteibaculaceae bacterium]